MSTLVHSNLHCRFNGYELVWYASALTGHFDRIDIRQRMYHRYQSQLALYVCDLIQVDRNYKNCIHMHRPRGRSFQKAHASSLLRRLTKVEEHAGKEELSWQDTLSSLSASIGEQNYYKISQSAGEQATPINHMAI